MARADDDHEQARHALEAGEILSLAEILAAIAPSHPGQILEVELEADDGEWLYEIKLLRDDGDIVKLHVDARDGRVLDMKVKGAKKRRWYQKG